MTRLQPVNLVEFTGGVNYETRSFKLEPTESPDMLNVVLDQRGGFHTRGGCRRWNQTPVVPGAWQPRHAKAHVRPSGEWYVAISASSGAVQVKGPMPASGETRNLYLLDQAGALVPGISVTGDAASHGIDFASWNERLFLACGSQPPAVFEPDGLRMLSSAGVGYWNDDYTVPNGGVMPRADHVESHAGYLFVANTREQEAAGEVSHPNRVRWSHPGGNVEDWAELDYIDIGAGGGAISALMSFQDHLLIFKQDQVWALYGYDTDSWQLVQVSGAVGAFGPQTVCKSDRAVYFYSTTGGGGIHEHTRDNAPRLLSEPLGEALLGVTRHDLVWLGWGLQQLFATMPFATPSLRREPTGQTCTTFAWDPRLGGAWMPYQPAKGNFGPIVADFYESLIEFPLVAYWGENANACLLEVAALPEFAADLIDPGTQENALPFIAYYVTSWQYAGWPELRKSWRRPRFIIPNNLLDVQIRVEAFRDYDASDPARVGVIVVRKGQGAYWRDLGAADPAGDGFDWDDGTLWDDEPQGSQIVRGTPLGKCRALQLRFTLTPDTRGTPWGIDAIILKVIARRFTT